MYSLIVTATMNDVEPQASLADVLVPSILANRQAGLLIGTSPVGSPCVELSNFELVARLFEPFRHQFTPVIDMLGKTSEFDQATHISRDYGIASAEKAQRWKITGITRLIVGELPHPGRRPLSLKEQGPRLVKSG